MSNEPNTKTPAIHADKNIRFTPEAIYVHLQHPIVEPFNLKEVRIRTMTTKDYRELQSPEASREELFELLQKLSGLPDFEIESLKPHDLGTCLGVVKNFLHGIQVPLLRSMQSSSNFLAEYLQLN